MLLACFTDGCSIPIQCSSDAIEQSKFYNGYQGDTMVQPRSQHNYTEIGKFNCISL